MCGIIGYVGKKSAGPILLEGLRRLEYRGYDSAGVAVLDHGALELRKKTGRIDQGLAAFVKANPVPGETGIGHTRWATHGPPCDENSHPHLDASGRIAVVHNGVIENYDRLKQRLRAGARLFPLTKERAKPAVPLAGKYRLVDIPISNCINSDLKRIYLLTQFNSASLHRHISQSYKFDHFSGGFVELLAAEQTFSDTSWYQGTADAVRKNLVHLLNHDFEYVLILSGDQLYRMDFRSMLRQHIESGAEVSIATIPVHRKEASSLGIMQIDRERRITRFVEKPKEPDVQDSLKIPRDMYDTLEITGDDEDLLLASMGIYIFNRDILIKLLDNALTDFGKHIIPGAIETHRVFSYVYQGYWEDIGTIRAFFEANLDITSELPRFNFFDMTSPIFSRPRWLPASKINGAQIDHAIISDGCIITHSDIHQSIIGIRSIISPGSHLHRTIVLGSDYYESADSISQNESLGNPRIGIGNNTRIENAIIDKNARIGNDVTITPAGKPENVDHPMYYVRDGIVIIPKNGVVPHGTVI